MTEIARPAPTEFYLNFLAQLKSLYPKTAERIPIAERISANLVCPEIVRFPRRWLDQAERIVRSFAALRELDDRQAALSVLEPLTPDPKHHSALMSYDFHVDANDRLRLIEINTNASMALIADAIYRTHGLQNGISGDAREVIFQTFADELALFRLRSGPGNGSTQVVIIDEKPDTQRLFAEFEMYRELFEEHRWEARIADPMDLEFRDGALWWQDVKIDLVYNRDTDFYLAQPRSSQLRRARDAGVVCVTPSAFEYRLLADKERLEELSRAHVLESLALPVSEKSIISETLIRTRAVTDFTDPTDLWRERKAWFFKPRRSFGGKAVYRGSSTSRGTFQQILNGDYLAQEYVPPGTVNFDAGEFKYDLRFYAYQNRIQLSCARLYQGQMTNSQTLGGGVAAIDWLP